MGTWESRCLYMAGVMGVFDRKDLVCGSFPSGSKDSGEFELRVGKEAWGKFWVGDFWSGTGSEWGLDR